MTDPILEQDPKLRQIVQRLVEALEPERIYLFGSRARGEAGSDSDYDVLVVVPRSDLPAHRQDQRAYRALKGIGVAKDVLVWTREEFESRSSVVCSLPATVLREGRLLYAA
ncbi:MAG: nucleotidyltransferase domain-containing protein [Gemmatimonadaceae bacterium]